MSKRVMSGTVLDGLFLFIEILQLGKSDCRHDSIAVILVADIVYIVLPCIGAFIRTSITFEFSSVISIL